MACSRYHLVAMNQLFGGTDSTATRDRLRAGITGLRETRRLFTIKQIQLGPTAKFEFISPDFAVISVEKDGFCISGDLQFSSV